MFERYQIIQSIKENIRPLVGFVYKWKGYIKQYVRYLKNKSIRNELRRVLVLNVSESIEFIINNHCSISRYGDGEFLMVWQFVTGNRCMNDLYFQKYDEKLGRRLTEILLEKDYNNNRHAIGVPYSYYQGIAGVTNETRSFLMYFVNKYNKMMISTINIERKYLDSELTRFYITRRQKSRSKYIVKMLSQIWEKRDICFIEGIQSRLGVNNDLFNNANSIVRILCPAENAFDRYDEILESAKQLPKDKLIIIALGMTATVLSYDLSKLGFQALDLGHIDIEYEWMQMKVKKKIPIPHKYTNEAKGGKTPTEIYNETYNNQIIAKIGC